MPGTRLVIADRHPIVLQGLMSVFAAQRDFEIVASCSSGTSCVEAIRNLAPDIALLEDSLPGVTASEILAIVDAEGVSTRLVFFAASIEHGDLAAAVAAGACSVISKYASPETLLRYLRRVAEGTGLLPEPSPELVPTGNGANITKVLAVLTDREREIMRLVSEGLSNKAIARRLNISDGTIKVHLQHIYQKLEIHNRTVLAALAVSQRYGGFGTLSLAALSFASMGDVQAADPDATFLDDDSIAYKDLEHGAFELWTKEAIPRRIIVDDPEQTIVLNRVGSSISVSQVTNSAARMDELQAAQQAALANFAKGYGPNGSSTPYYFNPQLLQPINYIPPGSPTTQNSLPPLESAPNPIYYPLIPPPLPPVPQTGSVVEAGGATPGTPVATGTVDNAAVEVSSPTASDEGYGTFTMTAAGVWTYTLENTNQAVQVLNVGDTLTDTFTVTTVDGTPQVVTITITGSNDAAVISGTTSGAVIEAGSLANAAAVTATATGTLTNTDVDNPANTFTAISSPMASLGGYGTFTMTATGVWTYTLDNTNPTVQALNSGETLTDTFTVTTVDGTAQLVTVTIAGTNDAAVISGTTAGSVIEAGGVANATPGTPAATGTLTGTDVDGTPNAFTAVSSPTASDEGYGTYTMTADGVWTYTIDNASSDVQALNTGATLTDTFTVTAADGTAQVITITVNGSNDAAIVSGTSGGAVIEAGGVANATPGTPTATGTLTDSDVDNAPNTFTAVTTPRPSTGGYGTFTMTAAGVWFYTLDNANSEVQALNAGDTLTDTFTVTTVDGTAQVVTVTIAGTNDAAVISGTASGAVIEADGTGSGTPVATGTLTDIDVDDAANTFTAVSSPTESDEGYGAFTMTAAGVWTYTLDDNNSAVQALDVGDTLTDTFTVTTADGTTQVVTVSIHGSSDADPNDFDYLAPGPEEVSDSPFVYGTPQGENIAGGGDQFQIIYAGAGEDTVNGTGRDDILYSGSGNDTIKGNDGNDTIYGGSGSDTINGNNGNDTIIGGFGGDRLTGSNGDDAFVYLAAADSNSVQFDTISDFSSGVDRINLAAFGALAFMALSPTATSVPPHTIAWIYDSANNQTIVYVNQTDQTLDIGDPALLEIHLQGVASVQEPDFVYEPATADVATAGEAIDPALVAVAEGDLIVLATNNADVSVDATVSVSARVSDGGWFLPADGEHFSFHFNRIDSTTGSAKLARFGDAPAYATEDAGDDAAITLASASAIELPRGQATGLMEDHFTFDQGAVQASVGAMATGEAVVAPRGGTIDHGGFIMANVTGASQAAEHGATPGSGAIHGQSQSDSHTASANASNNSHSQSNPNAAGEDQPAPAEAGHAVTAAAPEPGDSFQFKNEIAASKHSDAVDPADVGHGSPSSAHDQHVAGHDGPAATQDTEPAGLLLAEQNAADQARGALHHGSHDLIV